MTEVARFPWSLQAPIYATAFFTGNLFPMSHVVMPLWALELGASPLLIGIIISSRQILPVTLSIHGGALLDRFGARRVIMVLGTMGAVSTGLFPALPFIWAVLILQMITGFAETTNWIGAQSAVGSLMRGQAVYAGRMTACARIGGFFGPWLVGLSWQFFGPVGGFLFLAGWSVCGAVAASFLPRHRPHDGEPEPARRGSRRAAAVMPRLSDYRETLGLLLLPAIALVIAATFLRQTGSGIQASFYGVWLTEIGLTAGTIGLLIGIGNAVSALSALTIGPLGRLVADYWLLIVMVMFAIVGIAIVPALESFFLLVVAASLRGAGQGLNLPLMMSIASRAVPLWLQGRAVALRITFNRFGSLVFPVIMGGLAEVIGLEYSFYVVGASGVLLLCVLSFWVARSKDQFES